MRFIVFALAFITTISVQAQQLLPTPRNIQHTYTKGTRSVSGSPGKNYWQNTANYDIDVAYDPVSRLVSGTVEIVYSNNSPDTLSRIWFKLYPNLYKKGSPRDGAIAPADLHDGVVIDSLWINNQTTGVSWMVINGTNASGRQVVLPGQKVNFRIRYHYTLNKGSHNRTGEVDAGAAFIAYFFPRIAVYDDIDGWNTIPYTGSKEFYNDFCHFSVGITVPSNYIVWATGELKNAKDILSPVYHERLEQAGRQDQLMYIIDSTDLKKGNITIGGKPTHTWHFDADDVTDFAFALSDHYLWRSSSIEVDRSTKRRTRVDAAFNAAHRDYFHVASDARKTVEVMSYIFPAWPFPYPHITVFDGLDQMEYPMMANDNPVDDREESVTLTTHEVFHTMFPFYMGTNETKYAWMDEGWATLGEWLISPFIDSSIIDRYGVTPTAISAGNETDLPVVTPSTELNRGYFANAYPKPAMGYLYIKDYLGDALFTKALHHYIRQWKGKHPMPNDFFYAMNAGSGKNLNWFWKRWFFEGGIPDLGIASVKKSGTRHTITVVSKGSRPVPVDLTVYYTDGSTQKLHRNIGVWEKGNKTVTLTFTSSKTINRVELGHEHTADSNVGDNVWRSVGR